MIKCRAISKLFKKLHPQIYASQLMTSSIIQRPVVLLNLESVKRKGKNYKNLREKKSFLDEMKNIVHSF